MLRITTLIVVLCLSSAFGYTQSFEFPSKQGKISLWSESGLVVKNQPAKFEVKSLNGADLNDLTIIGINGSIAHSGSELHINVANETLIYLLAMYTEEGGTEFKYYDLIGVPIAPSTYPYISVYADGVPIHPKRGVPGNTKNISMNMLYGELQGSCQSVFVNQVAVSFTDRQRAVGSVRNQGNEVAIRSLLSKGASAHLQIEAKAESIGCTNKNGVLKSISPKINKTFAYSVTSTNLDKDVEQIIGHLNAESRKQLSADAEN